MKGYEVSESYKAYMKKIEKRNSSSTSDDEVDPFLDLMLWPLVFVCIPIFFIGGVIDFYSSNSGIEVYKWPAKYWSILCILGSILGLISKLISDKDEETWSVKTWFVIASIAFVVLFNVNNFSSS